MLNLTLNLSFFPRIFGARDTLYTKFVLIYIYFLSHVQLRCCVRVPGTLTGELIGNGCCAKITLHVHIPLVSHAPMRPKAGGLAKHGGPPGWLEENDPAGVISSCFYVVNVHNHPSWAASRKEGMTCYSIIPMTSLCIPPATPLFTPSPQLLSSTELS